MTKLTDGSEFDVFSKNRELDYQLERECTQFDKQRNYHLLRHNDSTAEAYKFLQHVHRNSGYFATAWGREEGRQRTEPEITQAQLKLSKDPTISKLNRLKEAAAPLSKRISAFRRSYPTTFREQMRSLALTNVVLKKAPVDDDEEDGEKSPLEISSKYHLTAAGEAQIKEEIRTINDNILQWRDDVKLPFIPTKALSTSLLVQIECRKQLRDMRKFKDRLYFTS